MAESKSESSIPSAEWPLAKLAKYIHEEMDVTGRAEDEIQQLGRKSVLAYFNAGRALQIARDLLRQPTGKWVAWQDEQKLNRATVGEYMRFYEAADKKGFDAIAGMQLSEAKRFLGLVKNGKRAPKTGGKRTGTARIRPMAAMEKAETHLAHVVSVLDADDAKQIAAIDVAALEALAEKISDEVTTIYAFIAARQEAMKTVVAGQVKKAAAKAA